MTSQDYARLLRMEAQACDNVVILLRSESEGMLENGLSHTLVDGLKDAAFLVENDRSACVCFEASHRIESLSPLCHNAQTLEYVWVKNVLLVIVKRLRDLMVLRCQLTVPFGDERAFREAVDLAHGSQILQGSHLHSLVMNAYRKNIREKFECLGFKSNSEIGRRISRLSGPAPAAQLSGRRPPRLHTKRRHCANAWGTRRTC